jgi:hypothetical protein
MAGFLSGFFGSRQKADEQPAKPEIKKEVKQEVKQQAKVAEPVADTSGAYYLDFDQARTLGDIDYMRTAKTVKRTYAKSVSQPNQQALIQSVSSSQAKKVGQNQQSVLPESNGATSTAAEGVERRRADSSMDMFRNMAKDLRK